VLHRLANSALVDEDLDRARALTEESLELHRRFGSRKGEGLALGTLGDIEWRSGNDRARALELAEQSAAIAGDVGYLWWQAAMLYNLCEWSLELDRADDAERFARESLALAQRIADRMLTVYLLALLARIAAAEGDAERAGLLWGAIEAEEQRGTVGQWEAEREAYAAPVLAAAGREFERGRTIGRGLRLNEAVACALRQSAIGGGAGR
jgi:tetratricopeptide (TPR) repeat protein